MNQNFDYVHDDSTESEPYNPESGANLREQTARHVAMAKFPPIHVPRDRRAVSELAFAVDAVFRAEAREKRAQIRQLRLEAEKASRTTAEYYAS